MFADFWLPQFMPFSIALTLMFFIAITEIIGLLVGLAPSGIIDNLLPEINVDTDIDLEVDAPDMPSGGVLSQLLGWLCVGRVPALIILVAFLAAFGISGFILQGTWHSLFGFYIPALLMAIPALFLGLMMTRYIGLRLAKLMPKDETDAISKTSFIGKTATIIRGLAKRNHPAEAKLSDLHGQTHYILVEPDEDGIEFQQGTEVIIINSHGSIYQAITNNSEVLSKK